VNEDDTFRVLSRKPLNELKRMINVTVTLDALLIYDHTSLATWLQKYGWTIQEFIDSDKSRNLS
jgi:hypothetical protein